MKWILTLLATVLQRVQTKREEHSSFPADKLVAVDKPVGRYIVERYRLRHLQTGTCTNCGDKLYTNFVVVRLPLSDDGEREVVWSKLCSRKCAGEILLKFM